MKRAFLGVTAAVAAMAFVGADAAAQQKVDWAFSIWGNPRPFTKGPEVIADYVKEKTGGNFTITIHYGESVSPARENLDAVSIGSIDAAYIAPSYHPGKTPLYGVLDLPFLPIPDIVALQKVSEAFYEHPAAMAELDRWNAHSHMTNILPFYEFMGRGSPPRTLEDWRGKRVRALGGHGDAMRQLGAVPTTVTASETYPALERGVIDAIGFPFSYAFGSFRLYEVSRWYTVGMGLGSIHGMTVYSKRSLEALPAEWRQLLIDAKPKAYAAMRQAYEEADEHWIPIYEQGGLERLTYTDEERRQFRESAGEPVWQKWVEDMEQRGLPGQEVLDFVLEQAEKHAGS